MTEKYIIALTVALGIAGVAFADHNTQSLAGDWQFMMKGPIAKVAELSALEFTDDIQLPDTMDTRKKGPENTERREGNLARLHKYVGPAWYRKKFTIPESWSGKQITLFLERTKNTRVWGDGKDMGGSPILCAPQEYALGTLISGSHVVTLLVDNSILEVKSGNHMITENTQENWNGIIGRIEL